MSSAARAPAEPAFISHQVSEARRYYLNLNPSSRVSLAVVCGGVERMRADYVVSRRTFPYYAIELVAEGSGTLQLKGRDFALGPGVMFAYGPGIPHQIRNDPRRPMRKYYVDFAGRDAARLLAATPLRNWEARHIASAHELIDIFEALGREALDNNAMAPAVCAKLLELALLKISQRALSGSRAVPRSYETYSRIRRHIETHFVRLKSIEAVADECHVTPMYIARLFRRFAGSGAYQFLLRLKMSRAAQYLVDEGLLVKETAERLGFTDPFQFSRAFRNVHGTSPLHLQQSHRHRESHPRAVAS